MTTWTSTGEEEIKAELDTVFERLCQAAEKYFEERRLRKGNSHGLFQTKNGVRRSRKQRQAAKRYLAQVNSESQKGSPCAEPTENSRQTDPSANGDVVSNCNL